MLQFYNNVYVHLQRINNKLTPILEKKCHVYFQLLSNCNFSNSTATVYLTKSVCFFKDYKVYNDSEFIFICINDDYMKLIAVLTKKNS